MSLVDKIEEEFALARHLLTSNFPTITLSGSYFALDSEIDVILLAHSVPVNIADPHQFIEITKHFAQQVIEISAQLKNMTIVQTSKQPEDEQNPGSSEDKTTFIRV